MPWLQYKRIVIFLFVLGYAEHSFAQHVEITAPICRADSLKQDIVFLKTILQSSYPSLYRYTDKSEIDKAFENCYASINAATTDLDLLAKIKHLFSIIKDGHLYCGPSPVLKKYIDRQAVLFPLALQFIENKAYVSLSNDTRLPAGTEITAINHKRINTIRKELFKYIVSDGNIETKKYYILDRFFSFYYLMAYGEQQEFTITYSTQKGISKTEQIHAAFERDAPVQAYNNGTQPPLKLTFRDNIAILTIRTFDSATLSEAKQDFRSFVDTAFKAINDRNISDLLIDLRNNGGGRDLYGSLLYSYLATDTYRYYIDLIAATKQLPYAQLQRNVSSYNDLAPYMLDSIGSSRYRLKSTAHPNLQLLHPNKNKFYGKVWVLINGLSFSTTAEFCAITKSNSSATFIGEETGGAYFGNTSGGMIDTLLPNTRINISFGTIEYKMAVRKVKHKDRGVLPDYIVVPKTGDTNSNPDTQLDFAIKIAGKNK